jgi:CRP/FNR family transcriptional regulator, cyclic AMP receptor protein
MSACDYEITMAKKKTPSARSRIAPQPAPLFDLDNFLDSTGIARTVTKYAKRAVVFAQGDVASDVFYLQHGSIRLSVLSRAGRSAVVATLGPGDFFGEGSLAGQPRRMATAMALTASTALVIEKPTMIEMLHTQPALADRFLQHMLARNVRVEEDLVDQLFNSSEKRLARVLMIMARYGMPDQQLMLPKMSQETLAEMVGTTRSRVNFFMNKFRDLGFIDYNGGLKINGSLITVVLHD